MPKYEVLSKALTARMESEARTGSFAPMGFDDRLVTRRQNLPADQATIWRPAFTHDIDKIMHCPYYNRYSDKTQVFSLLRNDDITRRSLHVQLVSRIARTIGSALHLNLDLIEAIALGHDIGHPPFAHAGERYLSKLYHQHTGRYFLHNLQSVRVLDQIFPMNLSLQTLNGIAGHNGEIELEAYYPVPMEDFATFDAVMETCCQTGDVSQMLPSTLEGAVVRICDIIAYLGKDRQDASRIHVVPEDSFHHTSIGSLNAEIINNLVVNVIENSYGQSYIKMDSVHFAALRAAKQENYARIYENAATWLQLDRTVQPMMEEIYGQLLEDLTLGKSKSPILTHHIGYIKEAHRSRTVPYEKTEPNQLVVDYIASMTDDYFIDLHSYLFPNSPHKVEYIGYFDL